MAGNQLNVIRRNLIYVGGAKQTNWGAAVAPTWFYWPLNGTKWAPTSKDEQLREMDQGIYATFAYKSAQYHQVTIVEAARPILAGYALQSLFGTNSDAYTAAPKSSTLSSSITVGATTFSSVGDLGNLSTGYFAVGAGYSSTDAETVNVNLVSRTGTGPYTYTLANSSTFKNAHASAEVVMNAATHLFTPQATTFDPYTLEFAYGTNATTPNRVVRLQDCVCTDLRITAQAGKAVMFQHTWYATQAVIQSAFTAMVLETSNPFIFWQGAGNWKINNLATGNAATITQMQLDLKRSTAPEDLLNETVNPTYFLPGNIDVTGQFTTHFTSWAQYDQAYYGTTAAANGATDSNLLGYDTFATTFNSDNLNQMALSLPNIYYAAVGLDPNEDAKPLEQQVSFAAVKSPTNPGLGALASVTLSNTQVGAY